MGVSEAAFNLALLALLYPPSLSQYHLISCVYSCGQCSPAASCFRNTVLMGFWHLEWKSQGGKKKGDSLGFQGQQRRLETSAVCLGTATLCSPAWGLPGEHAFVEQTLPLNQIPLCDNQTLPLMGMFLLQMHLETDTATT